MANLPDVDQQSWQTFSADRWFQQSNDRINNIAAMPTQPGLGFLTSSSSRIQSLQLPAPPVAPPIPAPQIQVPSLPQLPTQAPAPQPAPQPVPQPTPAPLPAPPVPLPAPAPPPSLSPTGLPPSPAPPTAPPPTEAPPPGLPTPLTPQTPLTPGPSLPTPPQRPVYAPEPAPAPRPSPFADQTPGGPFEQTTARPSGGGDQQIGYDPSAPAMQALNAAPQGDLQNYARQAAQKAGINSELFAAQIQQESGYNPNAGSPAGAQGVAQIVPKYHPGVDTSDPYASLDYAANLMSSLLKQYNGDWSKALIAYNGGGGAVAAWDSGQPYQESQTYVARILGSSRPNQNTTGVSAPGHEPSPPVQTPGTQIANLPNKNGQIFPLPISPDNAPSATYHSQGGSDLMAPRGTPVLNMQSGRVDEVFTDNGSHTVGGNAVLIHGDDGLDYYYAHFDQPTSLKAGQRVGAGEQIGAVGNSGNAFKDGQGATHLHIGIGYGISNGVGSEGGLGEKFNAQNLLTDLESGIGRAAPAVSTAADAISNPVGLLDQTRKIVSDSLSGRSAPVPRQAMTQFGAAPQQQTDEVTPPSQQQRPDYLSIFDQQAPSASAPPTGGAGGNPFDQLGQTISNAIRSALGGGAPPGGPRRPEDQNQQDQSQTGQSFGDRTRALIQQSQTLPGGRTLQDLGAPNILPPDFSGKSPGESVLAALEAAGGQALNRQSPVLGPGGLGVYDPRLGADPRQDVPPALDPLEAIGELVDRIRGAGPRGEEVARALDESFTRARANAPAAPGAVAGVPTASGGIGSAVRQMADNGAQSISDSLERNGYQGGWDRFVREYSDRNVDLNHIGEALQQRIGRPLTDDENVNLLVRFDPTNQSATATEMAIGSQLRAVPKADQQELFNHIADRTDLSIAEGLGKQAEQQYLEGGIAQSTPERLNKALEDWNSAQNALDEAQAAMTNPQTRESIGLRAAQNRVDEARAQLDAAAETARQVNSDAAREQVMNAPGSKVTTLPEYRDLQIAESNVQRLNQQYDKLYTANPDNPYLETLSRQVGRAEDKVSRLRTQMGESSAARGVAIETRAQTAADTAFTQQPRYNPTAEYAGANVKLRYEQQNLNRLQAQQARGVQGLADDVTRAEKRVSKALGDVQQAQADLPAAAKAQGWAQTTGRVFEGGRTYDQIKQSIADREAKYANQPERWQKIQDAAQAVFDYRKNLLQEKVDSGLITQDTADHLLRTYPEWTPTRLLDYINEEGPGGLGRGNRVNVNSNGFRRYTMEGTTKERQNHVTSLINEADQTYALAAKNRLFNSVVNALGGEHGGVVKRIADNWKEYEATGGEAGHLLHPDTNPLPGRNEFKLSGFVDGKKQEYVTDNPYIKQAIDNVGQTPDAVSKAANFFTRAVRETAVSRNPLWLAGNSIMDAAGYSVGTTVAGGVRRNIPSMALNLAPALITARTTSPDDPERGKKIAAAAVAGMGSRALLGNRLGLGPSAMREFLLAYGDVLKGLGSGRMTGEGVQQLRLGGAGMRSGNFYTGGVKAGEERLRELMRPNAFSYDLRNPQDFKKLISDSAFGWVKSLGDRFEQAPRVAAYRVARQRGETQLQAMARARDVTLDFDRGGRFSKALNSFVPFFNAGAQGGAQFARLAGLSMADKPVGNAAQIARRASATALAGISLVGMPTVASEIWNRSDPQRSKDYDNVPQYLKDQGVVIMLPGEAPVDKNGNRMPQHIDLNLREFAPFALAAREAFNRLPQDQIERAIGQPIVGQGQPKSAPELGAAAGQALQPLNVRNPTESILGLVPPGPGTYAQLQQNKDWYRGTTIANQFSDENASNLAKTLAPVIEQAVTKLPGQSAARVRPSHVDFAVRDMLNGLGSTLLGATDTLSGREPRAPGLLSDIPVAGSELGRFVRGSGGQERIDVTSPEAMMAPDIRQRLRSLGGPSAYYEPSPVPSDIQKIPLRQDEQVEYQRLTNQFFDQYMRDAMKTKAFDNEAARDVLRTRAMDTARKMAANQVLGQIRASGSSLSARYKTNSSAA